MYTPSVRNTAKARETVQEVKPRPLPNSSSHATYMTLKESSMEGPITWIMKEQKTMTQPYPPSGTVDTGMEDVIVLSLGEASVPVLR